jgi:hypothetical protein
MIPTSTIEAIVEEAKWPYARDEMGEPWLIVRRMIDDLESLARRGARMDMDALIELGWPEETAALFHRRAFESAQLARSLAEYLTFDRGARCDVAALETPAGRNDDGLFVARSGPARPLATNMRELHVFIAGMAGGLLGGALFFAAAFGALAGGSPQ